MRPGSALWAVSHTAHGPGRDVGYLHSNKAESLSFIEAAQSCHHVSCNVVVVQKNQRCADLLIA